ncbi:hypothetical protein D3C80_952760 [compost metagenome]
MKQDQINITLLGDEKEVIIRHGEALELVAPLKNNITGTIDAPGNYWEHFKKSTIVSTTISSDLAIVLVNQEEGYIILKVDPTDSLAAEVKGQLLPAAELDVFSINSNRLFTRDELIKTLRMNRILFKDKDSHAALINNITKFEAKVRKEIELDNDRRGNSSASVKKEITSDIPLDFSLSLPAFKGQAKLSFFVEICFDITDGGIRFWFESVELKELIDTQREQILNQQIERFDGLCIIQK